MHPIKTMIFQNSMNEKLLIQAPWAKFNRNVFCKKAAETPVIEGIRLIFEHQTNWFSGMTDHQIEIILSEVPSNYSIIKK